MYISTRFGERFLSSVQEVRRFLIPRIPVVCFFLLQKGYTHCTQELFLALCSGIPSGDAIWDAQNQAQLTISKALALSLCLNLSVS